MNTNDFEGSAFEQEEEIYEQYSQTEEKKADLAQAMPRRLSDVAPLDDSESHH